MSHSDLPWWKTATFYQVYPASYKDSNGDGYGDIPGMITTLDYLKDLGVDAVWLSPMFDSPQVDMGYDISDYTAVYPKFGTVADMDKLIKEMHSRDMKLILDLVINHTSDEHAWFKESRSSKDNEKADWYIWKKPTYVNGDRQPPNNWRAIFGGSAWEYEPARDEYYLHLFCPEQPDLNWENAVARRAIYKDAVEFWLERGVDGFRVDAVNLYSKNPEFPDADVKDEGAEFQRAEKHYINGPGMHEWLKEMRKEAMDKYGEVMLVGELPHTDSREEILSYISAAERELSIVFDFDAVDLGKRATAKHEWFKPSLPDFKQTFVKAQDLLVGTDAWTTVFLENHDQQRSINRFTTDDPKYRVKAGKILAMLLATLSGTLFIYQGQEIGMVNVPDSWGPEEYKDIDSINYWNEMSRTYPDNKEILDKALKALKNGGRDNARTAMQWNASKHAGFTTGTPWMRAHENYAEVNVEAAQKDPDSIYHFWQKMLEVRKKHSDVFIEGGYEIFDKDNPDKFTYTKTVNGEPHALIVLNFSVKEQSDLIPQSLKNKKLDLLVTNGERKGQSLGAWEGAVYTVSSEHLRSEE
jgi:oligo-1,6-glucosidase